MNYPLECATPIAGHAAENTHQTPVQMEICALMELLQFPKHGRTASDAPDEFKKEPARPVEPQTLTFDDPYFPTQPVSQHNRTRR